MNDLLKHGKINANDEQRHNNNSCAILPLDNEILNEETLFEQSYILPNERLDAPEPYGPVNIHDGMKDGSPTYRCTTRRKTNSDELLKLLEAAR